MNIEQMKFEIKCLEKIFLTETDNGIIINSEINLHEINKKVSILLTKTIMDNFSIFQCTNVINNFFKIFEGNKMGYIPMEKIIKITNFSNIVIDYKNGIIILLIQHGVTRILIKFDKEYELDSWDIIETEKE